LHSTSTKSLKTSIFGHKNKLWFLPSSKCTPNHQINYSTLESWNHMTWWIALIWNFPYMNLSKIFPTWKVDSFVQITLSHFFIVHPQYFWANANRWDMWRCVKKGF
jgi:hypothetical protein